jgi:hypothetical protein
LAWVRIINNASMSYTALEQQIGQAGKEGRAKENVP